MFDTLDPACRKILKLYWEELTPDQIAEKLGVTNGYVRKKKSEAQAQLVSRIKKHPAYRNIMMTDGINVDK